MFYLCNIKIVNRKKEKKYAKNKNLQQMFKDPRYSDVSLSFLIFFPHSGSGTTWTVRDAMLLL